MFWRARDMGFPFSFEAFRRAGANQGWNEAYRFDISAVERGPRSNFWDHSDLFHSTGFGLIDPNRPIIRGNCCLYYIWAKTYFIGNVNPENIHL